MLVTDGAPYEHKEIFEKFNWPQQLVRLFSYLIGREVTDVGNLLWMACANKGELFLAQTFFFQVFFFFLEKKSLPSINKC